MTMPRKGLSHLFQSTNRSLSSITSFSVPSPSPSSPLCHTFSASMIEEDIENAESIISKWDLDSSSVSKVTSLFQTDKDEACEFMKCVSNLRRSMHSLLSSQHSNPERLAVCQKLVQIAMKRLEKELHQILSTTSSNVEDEQAEITRFGEAGVSDLKSVVDCMISCGYTKECLQIYLFMRKSAVDEGLDVLGVKQYYKSSHIQRLNPESLENMVKNWMNAVNPALRKLFLGEKVLSDHLFSERIKDLCFSEVVKEGALNLFGFPELAARNKNMKLDRIFPLMDMYEALVNLWPDIDSTFSFESTSIVKQQAHSSLLELGESVRQTLSEFESTIHKDSPKSQALGGGIHPLSTSAMSYLSSLADYSIVLSDIIANNSKSYYESPTTTTSSVRGPAVSAKLAWLILVLLCKLDRKAEQYKDASLSYLFLANNVQFIVEKVCTTRLRVVLGEDWVFKHAKKAKQYATNYETMAWNKVFSCLPTKHSPPTQEAAAERFKRFNAAFEESHRKQMQWVVPNRRFRDELKVSIAKKLVPAYREFHDTLGLEVLVKFGPDDLENYLSDLFHGDASSGSSSSRGCVPR